MDEFLKERMDFLRYTSSKSDRNIVAALRQLSSGVSANSWVEMLRISESSIQECRRWFTLAVVEWFERGYIRKKTKEDAQGILAMYAKIGFPKAFRSLGCSDWKLNFSAFPGKRDTIGKYGKSKYKTESWVDDRLWIWHLQFGFCVAMSELNILDCLPLFRDVGAGRWPSF